MSSNAPTGTSNGTETTLYPKSFVVNEILITNNKGEIKDIAPITTKITIFDSLFVPALITELDIRDASNFFEEFGLTGQEIINISVTIDQRYRGKTFTKKIDLAFYITEYPNYSRSVSEHVQKYTLRGVTPHGYLSPLKKISRSVNGSVVRTIKTILENDLAVEDVEVFGTPASNMKGIIPIQSPLKAINWLKSKSYDTKNSPFFVYQTLDGKVRIDSLYEMIKQPVYNSYTYKRNVETAFVGSEENYYEMMTLISKIESIPNLSKSYQLADGAYAGRLRTVDIGSKITRERTFDHNRDINESLNGTDTISGSFGANIEGVGGKLRPFNELAEANLQYSVMSLNSFDGSEAGDSIDEQRIQYAKSWLAKFDTLVQKIIVPGDVGIQSGRVVSLNIPKSIDINLYNQYTGKDTIDEFDRKMSGKYLIFSTIHVFENGKYETHFEARKDSL